MANKYGIVKGEAAERLGVVSLRSATKIEQRREAAERWNAERTRRHDRRITRASHTTLGLAMIAAGIIR